MAVRIFPYEIEGETGLDVDVLSEEATVADLLAAMQAPADDKSILKPFHKQRYARCAGCINNCCKYNCITVDLIAALALASRLRLDLAKFALDYLMLSPDLPYPEFGRRPCPFLQDNRCTAYAERALICRLYLCTPMTDRLEQLRSAVSFAGEAALRQRLVDLGLAPANWTAEVRRQVLRSRYRRGEITKEQWLELSEQLEIQLEHNPFQGGRGYDDVRLRECCTDRLWQQLTNTNSCDLSS